MRYQIVLVLTEMLSLKIFLTLVIDHKYSPGITLFYIFSDFIFAFSAGNGSNISNFSHRADMDIYNPGIDFTW